VVVIIVKETLDQEINTFLHEKKHYTNQQRSYRDVSKRQIQQALQECSTIIEKERHKYLINKKPTAPKPSAYVTSHKEGAPMRPVINSTQAPSYRIAKYLNKKLQNLINLPNNYTTKKKKKNCLRTTQHPDQRPPQYYLIGHQRFICEPIPIEDILQITNIWLQKQRHNSKFIEQTIHLLKTILKQKYFQYGDQYYQPTKGIAMGSPISSTVAEIYLQNLEDTYLQHSLEDREILYYKRYVDDIFIVYD
jgi:hypothetical protein